MTAIVIDFAGERQRRAAALAWVVAECRKAVQACRPGSWQQEVCQAELESALRALAPSDGARHIPGHDDAQQSRP